MITGTEAIVGNSRAIEEVRELIHTVAPTRLPVLIQGPTGCGKELVASAIHAASGRRGAFVPFNVCAIAETMFEDALFGHVRGAFTGASIDVPGYFREANDGTVFLDEVSDLPVPLQTKLLRAIETGVFRPVGAKYDARSDFRVLAATNQDMRKLVAEGRLRPDLAHRIGAVVIDVPPLSQRLEDVPLLVQHFLRQVGATVAVSHEAIAILTAHHWPGNIRELRNVVEWTAVLSEGSLRPSLAKMALARAHTVTRSDDRNLTERRLLREILELHGWDAHATSRALRVHRATLYRRMKRLGIVAPSKCERAIMWSIPA